jgi:hypothetical protein
MSDAPGTIYLQYDPEGETTWCEDKINDDDIVYVLATELEQLRADRDSESRWAKEYLARAEKAEAEVKRLRDAAIITDTNGMRCLFCEGQDDDYEGVIHKDDCPLKDGPP